MEKRELTCIGCPMGCLLTVELEDGAIQSVSGFTCPRGEIYAKKEVTDPTRIVTSTVKVIGGVRGRVSCKTASDVPKNKIFDVMKDVDRARVFAPVNLGDVLIENAAGTGVNVVATASVKKVK